MPTKTEVTLSANLPDGTLVRFTGAGTSWRAQLHEGGGLKTPLRVELDTATNAPKFTLGEVSDAANKAADDVLEAIEAPDGGVRDAVNLVVNAAIHYLDNPDDELEDAITSSYDEDADPIEWAKR